MQRVRIADLNIEMSNVDTAFFEERLAAYRCENVSTPDLRITFTAPDSIPIPEGPVTVYNERLRVTDLPDGRRLRGLYHPKTGELLQTITCNADYSEAEICVPAGRSHPTLSLLDFEYMFTGLVFSDRITHLGGLVLHGSSLAFDDNGLIFSAPSGTGKSTHTGLWRETYGERVTVINDDKPAVRFNEMGQPLVYGTPWSGKTDLNTNTSAPLRAVVFLERGTTDAIRRLSATEALLYMNRELSMPYHDESLGLTLLDTATRLVQTVPMYLLSCTPTPHAVETVRETLGL